jgi:IS5 family transposase
MEDKRSSSEVAYARETESLARFKALNQREDVSTEELAEGMRTLTKDFERLLSDVKLLTSVGDRLQRKLKSANVMLREQSDEIRQINGELQSTNTELKLTIDELTKAKASRRAQTYVLFAAVALFVISELIEKFVLDAYFNNTVWEQAIGWGLKALLVIMIKPLEGYIERRLVKAAMNAKSRELVEKHTTTPNGSGTSLKEQVAQEVKAAEEPVPATAT